MLKKLFLTACLLARVTLGWSQQSPPSSAEDGDIVAEIAASLSTLDASRITSGVLLDRAIPVSDPHAFTGSSTAPQANYATWQQQYGQFYQASLSTSNLLSPQDMFARVQARIDAGQAPLLLLNYTYHELLPTAAQQGLIRIDSLNERVYDGPNLSQSPYRTGQVFTVALPVSALNADGSGTFYVGSEFWVGNTPAPAGVYVDLGDGTGARYVTMGSTLQVPPGGSGTTASRGGGVTCTRVIIVSINGQQFTYPVCKIAKVTDGPSLALGISAQRQWPGAAGRATAIAWVKWGRGNMSGKFRKPLVFVEGIDFEDRNGDPDRGNDRKHNYFKKHSPTAPIAPLPLSDPQFDEGYRNGEAGWDEMVAFNDDYKSLEKLPVLRQSLQEPTDTAEEGYDVVYLDFTDGADQIENNAMTLVDLLTYITDNREGNQGTVVMGASMGGQVARFALAWMEEQKLCNDVKLYVSFDSPHRGANVAVGIQHMLNRLAKIHFFGRGNFLEQRGFLNRPASRQMLNYHFDPDAAPVRTAWQAWQNSPTSFPGYMRKVAVSNGDRRGNSIKDSRPGMELLSTNTGWQPISWGQNNAYALPGTTTQGVNNVVFRYKVPFGIRWKYVTIPATTPAYDTSPGGMRQTAKLFNDQAPAYFETKLDYDTFIPLISALGVTDAEVGPRAAANVNYDAFLQINQGKPNAAKYAFDAYFASSENEPHVQITNATASTRSTSYLSDNSSWLRNELDQSMHQLPATLTGTYNFGNLYRRYLPTVTVANGGQLLVNVAGVPVGGGPQNASPVAPTEASFDVYAATCARVTLQQAGVLRLGNAAGNQNATLRFGGKALLDVQSGSQLTVHPNSILRIQRGGTLVVRRGAILQNNGQIIVESGAFVCIENMADIQGQKPVYQLDVNFYANPALALGSLTCQPNPVSDPACATASSFSLTKILTYSSTCSSVFLVTASGNNIGTNFNWTINGFQDPTYNNESSVYFELDAYTSRYDISVTVGSACLTASSLTSSTLLSKTIKPSCGVQVQMYPNPTASYLQFTAEDPNQISLEGKKVYKRNFDYKKFTIALHSAQGRVVTKQTTQTGSLRVDTSTYPEGLYYVEISHGNQISRLHLSVQH